MYIENLALQNYRNYARAEITFSDGINILYGDNAQGKTNILEAIYLIGTTKSHRGSKDREIIRFDADESHIRAEIKKDGMHRHCISAGIKPEQGIFQRAVAQNYLGTILSGRCQNRGCACASTS